MSRSSQQGAPAEPTDAHLEEATRWFLRLRESACVEDLPGLQAWIDSDPLNKVAYQQVAGTWGAIGQFSAAPEIMVRRRDALDDARRAARRRWSVRGRISRYVGLAASVAVIAVGALVWLYLQRGVYSTDIGERRALTLEDGSLVTLDARSRIRVRYDPNERLISLERGQARFDVAKDPTRAFRVRVGDQTVIALGTQFNVERVAGNVFVSMIEGHVAVTGADAATTAESALAVPTPHSPIELKTGEALRVSANGRAVVLRQIDVSRATAWQAGKLFFDNEPLVSAAERVNRYSQLQIVVDSHVANVGVSGVFNAGDTNAFVEAISTYFAVEVDRESTSTIHLTARH